MNHLRPSLIGFFAAAVCQLSAAAECASPVAQADLQKRGSWADVETMVASASLNPAVKTVQEISTHGIGNINNDFYAITVDANGETPQILASFLRKNLDRLVFDGSNYRFYPYDEANEQRWNSANAKGAVMSFLLAGLNVPVAIALAAPLPPNVRGSVVMSCEAPSNWMFSTVMTPRDGWHPVSGNRSFGVSANPDGSLRIWTKGADRAVKDGPIGMAHTLLPDTQDQTFLQGHAVWVRLLNNLSQRLAARHPRDREAFSVRRPYPGP